MMRDFGNLSLAAACLAVLWPAGAPLGAAPPARRDVPDLGLILNDDAYSAFTQPKLADSVRDLQERVDAYAAGNIGTLCYSLGEGSDILVYPTKVASTWGWRPTPYDEKDRYKERIARNREAIEQGGDALRTAGERAKQRGMYFFPSLRMNDSHFMTDPHDSPFTGRFWIENEHLKIKRSPIVSRASYGELLDYSHAEVRQYRLDVIFEAIDRYADLIDGFELDFNRVQVFFPLGEAEGKAHLMTDLVAQVRTRLDELGEKNGRDYYLIVRVPPSVESCTWAGLDVGDWMRRRLVDVVSPAQLMTMGYELPVEDFLALADGTGCKVYPSLYPRTTWRWSVEMDERELTRPSYGASQNQLRAAAANMWALGADGLYLYNYRKGMLDDAVQDIGSPEDLAGTDKCFTVTKAYYLDHEGTYEHRKQLPVKFANGAAGPVKLMVGDDLASASADAIARCVLRLGTRGLPDDARVRVAVNGDTLYAGALRPVLFNVPEAKRALSKAPDLAQQLVYLPVDRPGLFHRGHNTLVVQVEGAPTEAQLIDVELAVDYAPAGKN